LFYEIEKIILKHKVNYIGVNPEICELVFRFGDYPEIFSAESNMCMMVNKMMQHQMQKQ
jgi:hypothetical protein